MNLYDLPDFPASEEIVTELLRREGVRLERIVSTGQTTDWYDQEEGEYVILLDGIAEITLADGSLLRLTAGETLLLPPHLRHRVSYTSIDPACVWLCVFWRE